MRAALFITCFNDTLFPDVGRATVTVLERLGVEVDFPEEQTCCGQMHWNSGYQLEAAPLARRFVRTFADAEAIVCPSASCAGMVREGYPRLAGLAGGEDLARAAADVIPRVYELTEFLVDVLGAEDVGASFPHRVTYHPTCHSLRALHVGDRPQRLPRAVPGTAPAAAAAGRPRDRRRRARRGGRVLRVRRHLRRQERRHVHRDALRQAAPG